MLLVILQLRRNYKKEMVALKPLKLTPPSIIKYYIQ